MKALSPDSRKSSESRKIDFSPGLRSLHMSSDLRRSRLPLDRILSLEIARVTERAAVAAAKLRGRGNEKAADQAAVDAMRREMNKLAITGTIVIGERERDEAPML